MAASKTGKKQPSKARGADFQNHTRSVWHELAVRAVLYIERHSTGPFKYSAVADFLAGCGVTDARNKPISVPTLKRTLKRPLCRQMLKDFRLRYRKSSDAELLQFDPDAPKVLRKPAVPSFEDVLLVEKYLRSRD